MTPYNLLPIYSITTFKQKIWLGFIDLFYKYYCQNLQSVSLVNTQIFTDNPRFLFKARLFQTRMNKAWFQNLLEQYTEKGFNK